MIRCDEVKTYDVLFYYDNLLKEYSAMLFTKGLDLTDFEEINSIVSRLYRLKHDAYYDLKEYIRLNSYILTDTLPERFVTEYISTRDSKREYLRSVDDLLGGYVKICDMLKKSVVPRTLGGVLNEECSLSHMVFTNDKSDVEVTPYGLGSFMFLCQFHVEKNPSMSVSNYRGTGHCYACGTSFNLVSYFMNVEQLTYQEAVNLLAKIYLIDLKNEIYSDNHPLVVKYRESLLRGDYRKLLETSIDKMAKKEESWEVSNAISRINRDIKTIDRVNNGESIWYSGKKPKCKRLVLEMPPME